MIKERYKLTFQKKKYVSKKKGETVSYNIAHLALPTELVQKYGLGPGWEVEISDKIEGNKPIVSLILHAPTSKGFENSAKVAPSEKS